MDETPEQWQAFVELMLSTWDFDSMAYMHLTVMSEDYEDSA